MLRHSADELVFVVVAAVLRVVLGAAVRLLCHRRRFLFLLLLLLFLRHRCRRSRAALRRAAGHPHQHRVLVFALVIVVVVVVVILVAAALLPLGVVGADHPARLDVKDTLLVVIAAAARLRFRLRLRLGLRLRRRRRFLPHQRFLLLELAAQPSHHLLVLLALLVVAPLLHVLEAFVARDAEQLVRRRHRRLLLVLLALLSRVGRRRVGRRRVGHRLAHRLTPAAAAALLPLPALAAAARRGVGGVVLLERSHQRVELQPVLVVPARRALGRLRLLLLVVLRLPRRALAALALALRLLLARRVRLVGDHALVALLDVRDERAHAVDRLLPRLAAQLPILLLHRAAHVAVRRRAQVVLVGAREGARRREALPRRVEGAHLRPRRLRRAERRHRRVLAARRHVQRRLVLVERVEDAGVRRVEALGAVAEAAERARREERPQVDVRLLVVALVVVARAVAAAQDRLAVAVVPPPLVRVAEHRVRRLDLLEPLRRLVDVVGVLVGMMPNRGLAVGLL